MNFDIKRDYYTWMEIDVKKIKNNYKIFRDYVSPAVFSAVLKADGYGVGSDIIASALYEEGCRDFFVAYIDEADSLAKSLFKKFNALPRYNKNNEKDYNLYILDGPFVSNWCKDVSDCEYVPVLNTIKNVKEFNEYALSVDKKLPAVLHIDTGLHRLGMSEKEYVQFKKTDFKNIDWKYFMSHFVASSMIEHDSRIKQIEKVNNIRNEYPDVKFSFADTSGVLVGKHVHHDMVRVGMGLYGFGNYLPGIESSIFVYGKILQIQDVMSGEGIGYCWDFVAKENMKVATISCGYADGIISYKNSSFSDFIINGKQAPIVGQISMDLTIVDVTNIDNVNVGDNAVVFGHETQLKKIKDDGILYKVLTGVSKRIRKVVI